MKRYAIALFCALVIGCGTKPPHSTYKITYVFCGKEYITTLSSRYQPRIAYTKNNVTIHESPYSLPILTLPSQTLILSIEKE